MSTALISLSRLAAPSEPVHGTRITATRDAVDHWSRRASDTPWHRRAARREARAMVTRSRAELVGAHLERWSLSAVERRLTPLLDTRGRSGGAHLRTLAFATMRRTPLGRKILLAGAGVAAGSLVLLAAVIALATHLIV
jgi:hypothetical protein